VGLSQTVSEDWNNARKLKCLVCRHLVRSRRVDDYLFSGTCIADH
jgi:hypothetical protein